MGIKHLWGVLTPFCDRKPLYELQGKTVAIDLSCWICEAQNITEYQVQPRMYLRNLYFRTCYLLLMDVNPVFVLEGKAPELKYDTISARNVIQFKGARPKTNGVKTGKDRSRFHFVLRQCEEMLRYMGLACVTGTGEAESLCAYLNEDGLVDGCISQDSDCFAYGAQVVYRNFSISTQGVQSASGGAVDVYDIRKANESLKFGRNKIVAMALLIGSDYSDGVHGVGKDSAMKFFETVPDEKVLDRLRSWRTNKNMYQKFEAQLNDKNICTSCGHSGRIQSHTKKGCCSCNTTKGCNPFQYKEERLLMKNEVSIRNKAMEDPNFPNEELIKEFLHRKDNVRRLDLRWKQPNLVKFLKFTTHFLQWEELYSFEKILPVLTRWQCKNPALLKNEKNLKGVLKPVRIKKIRNPKGIPSYEIIWCDPGEYFKGLIPENQLLENNVDMEKLWSTIEPQNLVEVAYPDLVETFKQSKIKPKKVSKRKKKNVGGITEKLADASLSKPKAKKRKSKQPKGKNAKPLLDTALQDLNSSIKVLNLNKDRVHKIDKAWEIRENREALDRTIMEVLLHNSYKNEKASASASKSVKEKPLSCNISTPLKSDNVCPFDLDISTFGDESDLHLSEIIDEMVSKKTAGLALKKIAREYVANDEEFIVLDRSSDDLKTVQDDVIDEGGNGSFFMHHPGNGEDLFEKTFNATFKDFGDSSGSDTDLDDAYEKKNVPGYSTGSDTEEYDLDEKENVPESPDDSFCTKKYVPLYERLKLK